FKAHFDVVFVDEVDAFPLAGDPTLTQALHAACKERHDDLYAGIDLITSKLERQVRKYKTRVNRKNRDHGIQDVFAALPDDQEIKATYNTEADKDDDEDEIEIIRSKQFSLKPMDAEEAVLQMNLLGHDFFVFRD
ncbi:sigma 54 modulation/S30EA ribosomal C-terminal domain-containing protein, partial [Staphylococcus epidermidis]